MAIFDYAPAPESRDLARLKPHYGIFIDGAFRDGTGEAIKTINPATEEPLAEVAEAGDLRCRRRRARGPARLRHRLGRDARS